MSLITSTCAESSGFWNWLLWSTNVGQRFIRREIKFRLKVRQHLDINTNIRPLISLLKKLRFFLKLSFYSPCLCRSSNLNWISRKSAKENVTECAWCLFPSTPVLVDGGKQLLELILQSLPLNHHRRRGRNEMRSLKELQSKLKRWKTMWRTWWKYDISVNFIY